MKKANELQAALDQLDEKYERLQAHTAALEADRDQALLDVCEVFGKGLYDALTDIFGETLTEQMKPKITERLREDMKKAAKRAGFELSFGEDESPQATPD